MTFYEWCRNLNQYLGALGFLCLMWRIVPLAFDPGRWGDSVRLHRLLIFATFGGYIIVTAIAAFRALRLGDVPASWISPALTVLHLCTIGLCLWWPKVTGDHGHHARH